MLNFLYKYNPFQMFTFVSDREAEWFKSQLPFSSGVHSNKCHGVNMGYWCHWESLWSLCSTIVQAAMLGVASHTPCLNFLKFFINLTCCKAPALVSYCCCSSQLYTSDLVPGLQESSRLCVWSAKNTKECSQKTNKRLKMDKYMNSQANQVL